MFSCTMCACYHLLTSELTEQCISNEVIQRSEWMSRKCLKNDQKQKVTVIPESSSSLEDFICFLMMFKNEGVAIYFSIYISSITSLQLVRVEVVLTTSRFSVHLVQIQKLNKMNNFELSNLPIFGQMLYILKCLNRERQSEKLRGY